MKVLAEQRKQMVEQIGKEVIFMVSGGRIRSIENGVELPVGSGYSVRVELDASDTYVVSRVFKRGAKEWIKGSVENVYCDEVAEKAYFAGMFRSHSDGKWQSEKF